jgi:hypothetical protein
LGAAPAHPASIDPAASNVMIAPSVRLMSDWTFGRATWLRLRADHYARILTERVKLGLQVRIRLGGWRWAAFAGRGREIAGPPRAAGYLGGCCYGRVAGPWALMICSNATGGLLREQLPLELRAATARILSRYFPWPLIPAYAPVPSRSL